MTKTKKIGVWMDHASANLMEFTMEPIETKIVESKFSHQEKEFTLSKSDNFMRNKEQQEQSKYYKELGEVIKNYGEVVLFGPTNAKLELFNILRADLAFSDIDIEIQQADKMTENQQHAFVRDYFSKS